MGVFRKDKFSLSKMNTQSPSSRKGAVRRTAPTWILLCDECKRPHSKPVKSQGQPRNDRIGYSYYEIGISQMYPKYEGKCRICQGGTQPLKHIKPARFESDLE